MDKSTFIRDAWNQLRAGIDGKAIIAVAVHASTVLSSDFQDHHNAAELLMGAWSRLAQIGSENDRIQFTEQLLALPHREALWKQDFFRKWLWGTLRLSDETLNAPADYGTNEQVDGRDAPRPLSNRWSVDGLKAERIDLNVHPGRLTWHDYAEMAAIVYSDATKATQGLGGFVTLADTNAEIQGLTPQAVSSFSSPRVAFRNATAMHLEEVVADDSIVALAKTRVLSIIEVRLG